MTDAPRPSGPPVDATALDRSKYVALTTFRRNGEPVTTPVWSVRHGDGWACTTGADSGKVKRLRAGARIEVAPCDVRGGVAPGAPRFTGTGRVVTDPTEHRAVRSAVLRKYRVLAPLLVGWSKVTGLFGSTAAEGAVAWTVDDTA